MRGGLRAENDLGVASDKRFYIILDYFLGVVVRFDTLFSCKVGVVLYCKGQ